MYHLGLIVIVGSATAVLIVAFAVLQGRPARAAVARTSEPRSLVELLTTREAIADAARRAASFERYAAARSSERADHYESLAASVADEGVDATVHDIGQRSAS